MYFTSERGYLSVHSLSENESSSCPDGEFGFDARSEVSIAFSILMISICNICFPVDASRIRILSMVEKAEEDPLMVAMLEVTFTLVRVLTGSTLFLVSQIRY